MDIFNYALTSQKRGSDWLKISRRFVGLLQFEVFRQKAARNICKLLFRLKDKGKRYSTLESMLLIEAR